MDSTHQLCLEAREFQSTPSLIESLDRQLEAIDRHVAEIIEHLLEKHRQPASLDPNSVDSPSVPQMPS